MQIFKLLPLFGLLGAAYAGPVERRADSLGDCMRKQAWKTADMAPQGKPDIAVCYHGRNTATQNNGLTTKDADTFGNLHKASCNGVDLDCFWLRGQNVWNFYDGAGDNLAVIYLSDKCTVYNEGQIACDWHRY